MTGPVVPRALSVALGGLCVLLGSIGAVSVPSLLPMWIVLGGIIAGAAYIILSDRATAEQPPPPARTVRRRAALAGVATSAACLVLTGIVSVLGPAAGTSVVVILLLVLAVRALRALRQLPRSAPTTGGRSDDPRPTPLPPPDVPERLPDAADLPTPALCRAWQRSYFTLLDMPDGPTREDIAAWRGSLLDELERRDPIGFDRWMHSGARAGSDPARYLDLTTDH